jgi:hypothetical protein
MQLRLSGLRRVLDHYSIAAIRQDDTISVRYKLTIMVGECSRKDCVLPTAVFVLWPHQALKIGNVLPGLGQMFLRWKH